MRRGERVDSSIDDVDVVETMAFVFFFRISLSRFGRPRVFSSSSFLPAGGGRAARAACWRLASLPWFSRTRKREKGDEKKR